VKLQDRHGHVSGRREDLIARMKARRAQRDRR
jgi:hypothetical protein